MAFGHPKGLIPLFFTEMWERLAFYTMVGILLLYTIDAERGGLGLPRAEGNEIYGLYLAFVYFTPFLGGIARFVPNPRLGDLTDALDRLREAPIPDPVQRMRFGRHVAARKLVCPLRSGLDPRHAMRDRVIRSCMMSIEPAITSNRPGSGLSLARSDEI